jgi:hypothetical protein
MWRLARSAGPNPVIDFGQLELPQAFYPVGGQPLGLDPAVDRVSRDADMISHTI